MDTSIQAVSVLAFPLPPQLGEAVSRIWPIESNWLPHITLAYPPFIPKEEWSELRPLVAECLAAFSPFEITLAELDQFAGPEYILWLKPEDNGVIARIRTALEQALPRYIPPLPFDFVPHVTVGVFDQLEKLSAARQGLSRLPSPFKCCLDQVYYVILEPGRDWYLHDCLLLSEK